MANYKNIIPLIREVEGGLSKSKADTASNHPVPDGSGYHTNKGITWQTFQSVAPKCGYLPGVSLFYSMPDYVWEAIFKNIFWDGVKGDLIESQAIADTLTDWAWASGPGTACKKMQQFLKVNADGVFGPISLKAINDRARVSERLFNNEFSDYKLNWYLTLPNQEANYTGWKNRLTRIHEFTNSQIKGGL